MRIIFDQAFDAGAWPGPLEGHEAVAGEAWVGPNGLIRMLETALGLGGLGYSDGERAAALVPAIVATPGFWSRSANADPLGTARTLLNWRDSLLQAGWRAEPVAPRLKELAAVTRDVLPGMPDRAAAVTEALRRRPHNCSIKEITFLETSPELSRFLSETLALLKEAGVRITERDLPPASSRGDLAAARGKDFIPKADGTLQLVRPHAPAEAAEEIAAWLAARKEPGRVVLIGGDPILDAALRRHGLPTTGASGGAGDNLLLQIAPLVLELGWSPPDPRQALELLTLPTSPVPPFMARQLAEALHDWPAVDSDAWREAFANGLDGIDDKKRRDSVRQRLDAILSSPVRRGLKYPAAEVTRRLSALTKWMHGKLAAEEEKKGNTSQWHAAIRQSETVMRLLELSGMKELNRPQLEWFMSNATATVGGLSPYESEAGIATVPLPGAVAGPADTIVWWGFTRNSAPIMRRLPLGPSEEAALDKSGIKLPDPGRQAVWAARRWRRPLEQAQGALLLVCPLRGEDGEERYPHPLWDEIEAKVEDDAAIESLVVDRPMGDRAKPVRKRRTLLALPTPQREWKIPKSCVALRPKESPSSLSKLISCPFSYVAQYLGRLWGGTTAALPDGNLLYGSLAHEIIERLIASLPPDATNVRQEAEALFESEGPRLAAGLFLPGADAERATVRQVIGLAAKVFFEVLHASGLKVDSVEKALERQAFGVKLRGIPDITLGPRKAILDLKWGGAKYRAKDLAGGTAYQLAVYSYLLEQKGSAVAPVAYFILEDQRLLASDADVFPKAEIFEGPPPKATFAALGKAYKAAAVRLKSGKVTAAGVPDDDGEGPVDDSYIDGETGEIVLKVFCDYCDLGSLCADLGR